MFTKNRERLLKAEVAHKFLAELLNHKEVRGLSSDEHFSVDGTQVAAWASMKSFRAKDGSDEPPSGGRNGERDFHGETRSNDTHASTTDPDARLYRKGKGKEAKLSYVGNALTENRHGLVVEAELGTARHRAQRPHRRGWRYDLPAGVRHGPGGHRVEAADRALSGRPLGGLGLEGQEPGQPGDDPSAGSGLVMPAREKRKPQSRRPGPSPRVALD